MAFLDRDEGFCAGTKRQILSTSTAYKVSFGPHKIVAFRLESVGASVTTSGGKHPCL
jgi:hypothetical protein